MKTSNVFGILTAAVILAACSAKIEDVPAAPVPGSVPPANSDLVKKQETSPEVQELNTKQDGTNVAAINNSPKDVVRYFTFKPTKDGSLSLSFQEQTTQSCEIENMSQTYTLEALVDGRVAETIPTSYNQTIDLNAGVNYRVRLNLKNLGECEYIAVKFRASFQ